MLRLAACSDTRATCNETRADCRLLQGPIANLNAHLADPNVNNGFAYAQKARKCPLEQRGRLRLGHRPPPAPGAASPLLLPSPPHAR